MRLLSVTTFGGLGERSGTIRPKGKGREGGRKEKRGGRNEREKREGGRRWRKKGRKWREGGEWR